MHIKKRSLRIFFAIAVLIMMSLACEWSVPTPILPSVTCTKRGSDSAVCTYVCKKGGGILTDSFIVNYGKGGFANVGKEEELEKLCADYFPKDYSQPVSAASEATEPPTEAPTETPTAAPTEVPPTELPTPILTGDVTYCDASARALNLRLVDGFTAVDFNGFQVSMGSDPMNCSVNNTNSTLLTCMYPTGVSFPVNIKVETSTGSVVNEFEFNGSNCIAPGLPKDSNDSTVNCDPAHMPAVCIPLP
ncbi:MAG: hypothetical protein KA473_15425 [Anaerolineales bacterium]|nr:hypothetical protein [Anaerolineales bacterium]MBP6210822.1 hypothetical protein [Anaerolineales bacterium]